MNHYLKGWITLIQPQLGAVDFIFFLFPSNIIVCDEQTPTRQWFIAQENKPTVAVLGKQCTSRQQYK